MKILTFNGVSSLSGTDSNNVTVTGNALGVMVY